MTPQPQQDKDLDIIRDFIVMASDWEAQQEMALDALHRIRSRPAPAPDEKPCDQCDFNERDLQMAEAIMKAKKIERGILLDKLQYGGLFKMTDEIDSVIQQLRATTKKDPLEYLQQKSDQCEPVQVSQYERD